MRDRAVIAENLTPDSVSRLERAAQNRFETAEILRSQRRRLESLYFYGYSVEMCLSSAYFRCVGFRSHDIIDRDTRQRRMAQARQLRTSSGTPLMNGDPHPIVGWARFLEWQRTASGALTQPQTQVLNQAIHQAERLYDFWRPELRYKVIEFSEKQLTLVRNVAFWFRLNSVKLREG